MLRVPWADFNLLHLPEGDDHESDFTMLSDIFPTGYHGTELAMVAPGKAVAVFGAGPVGLMAAYSAMLRGAARVFVVDKEPDRLALAAKIGAIPIDFSQADPTETMMEATKGLGIDCGVECVGYQAHDQSGQEHPELVLDNHVQVVRATGHIGVVGVYVPEDPQAATEEAKHGRVAFDYGTAFTKGISIGSGQCPVMKYNRELRDLIISGRPSRRSSSPTSSDSTRHRRPTRTSTPASTAGPRFFSTRPPPEGRVVRCDSLCISERVHVASGDARRWSIAAILGRRHLVRLTSCRLWLISTVGTG